MIATLIAGKQFSSNYFLELLAHVFYPEFDDSTPKDDFKKLFGVSNNNDAHNWMMGSISLPLLFVLVLLICVLLFFAVFYIPLPAAICDKRKIHFIELLMRISNEYIGDIVELFFGPFARNKVTRWFCALPFILSPFGPPKWCKIHNEYIAGVRCRVYSPQGKRRKSNAIIVYIHGGGWCIMRSKFCDGPLLRLISRTGVTVVSVDYHLSPEHRFPTALLECERVIKALHEHKHSDFGIDPSRIAVLGDSAGANMCAVLCQRALRSGMPNLIKCQVLMYPVIHQLDLKSPSYQMYYDGYKNTALLNPKLLIRWYLMYLGIEPTKENIQIIIKNRHLSKEISQNERAMGLIHRDRLPKNLIEHDKKIHGASKFHTRNAAKRNHYKKIDDTTKGKSNEEKLSEQLSRHLVNPDICPLFGENLRGLASAMICTAGIDILRDEGMLYAERLKEFEVNVQHSHYESAYHGFFNMPMSKTCNKLLDDINNYLNATLFT